MPKVSKKSKNTQREALLSLIYQQELFDHVDEEDSGESKEFSVLPASLHELNFKVC
jgi:hypothetical protein